MGNKLFGTDGVRGVANVYPMTAEFALKLGMAAGQLVCRNKRKAAIARDTRVSGEMLEAALTAGFNAAGGRCFETRGYSYSGGNDADSDLRCGYDRNDYRLA